MKSILFLVDNFKQTYQNEINFEHTDGQFCFWRNLNRTLTHFWNQIKEPTNLEPNQSLKVELVGIWKQQPTNLETKYKKERERERRNLKNMLRTRRKSILDGEDNRKNHTWLEKTQETGKTLRYRSHWYILNKQQV